MAIGNAERLLFEIRADGDQAVREFGKLRLVANSATKDITDSFASGLPVLGKYTNSLGSTALGVTAVGAASVAAVAGVFALAKGVSEAGSRFNDLSVQSNLSVETLSGLELTVKQAGGSLEDLTGGMFRLQQAQAKARDGSDEAAAALRRVGVDARATSEDALRQFVTGLRQIEDVGARNAAGAAVMGKGYKNLAVLVNESTESIDQVIEKSREAGRVMSTEAARAADEFGDKLDEATYSLTAMLRQMASPALPSFIGALNDVTGASAGTAGGLREVGMAIASIIDGARIAAGALKLIYENDIYKIPDMYRGVKQEQMLRPGMGESQEMIDARARIVASQRAAEGANPNAFGVESEALAEKAKKDAERRRKEAEQARKEAEQAIKEALEREQNFANKQLQVMRDVHAQQMALMAAGARARVAVYEAGELAQTMSHQKAEQGRVDYERSLHTERIKRLEKELAYSKEVYASPEIILGIQRQVELENKLLEAFDAESRLRITNATIQDTKARLENVDAISKQAEALRAKREAEGGGIGLPAPSGLQEILGGIKAPIQNPDDPMFGPPPGANSLWQEWKSVATDALSGVQNAGEMLHGSLSTAFGGIARGAAQMVQGFLLGGKLSVKAFFEMSKGAIAAVTAEAAVRALFELAMGYASMWLNPAAAAAHFLAAKTFGLVAVVGAASVAGLSLAGVGSGGAATAGNAISGGGAGSNSSSNRSSANSNSNDPLTISESRPRMVEHVHIFRVESNDSHIIRVIESDVKNNGLTRGLIIETAAA